MTDTRTNQPASDERSPTSSPSGATDQTKERLKKFDEEGGDQPQAPTEQAVEDELARARKQRSHSH